MSERASPGGVPGMAGYATMLAVVLALLRGGAPVQPPPPAPAPRVTHTDTVSRAAATTPATTGHPVDPAPLRWDDRRTGAGLLREFLGQRADRPAVAGGRYRLDVLITTLPDPVDSHLDWMYDGGLEAVRRAAERAGYVIDRYWLPWPVDADSLRRLVRAGASPPHREQPGILLLRSAADTLPQALPGDTTSKRLLLVYVVGEVPTAGVAKGALVAALEERMALFRALAVPTDSAMTRAAYVLPRDRCVLRLIAPALSGSAVSLRRVLDAWLARRDSARVLAVDVVSGSTTGLFVDRLLTDTTPVRVGTVERPRMRFARTTHTAAAYTEAVLEAARRMGIPPRRIAYLREQTTQYGQQARPDTAARDTARRGSSAASADDADTAALDIPFPMNISGLRAEYARTAPLAIGHSGQPAAAFPGVRVDLLDSARAMESPPVMSRDLTPAGVEVALDEIARTLVAHRIQAVVVIATDVRDKLFLVSELRRRVRDVQVFVFGSSALLVRADRNRWLRGAIVASTYPLVFENQFWQPVQPDRMRSAFASDVAQGIFNAALWQLGRSGRLAEYATPFDSTAGALTRPPVWLGVIGARGMFPLAYRAAHDASARGSEAALRALARPPDHLPGHETLLMAVAALSAGAAVWALLLLPARRRQEAADGCLDAETRRRLDAEPSAQWSAADRRRLPRAVHKISLVLHCELYAVVAVVAVLGLLLPVVGVLLHHWPLGRGVAAELRSEPWSGALAAAAVGLLALLVVGGVGWCALRMALFGPVALRYGWRHSRPSDGGWRRPALWGWWLEIAARLAVLVAALAYLALNAWLAIDVTTRSVAAQMPFLHRLADLSSGVSPALPLLLVAASFLCWATYHVRRSEKLGDTTAFEEAQSLVVRAEARGTSGGPAPVVVPAGSPVEPVGEPLRRLATPPSSMTAPQSAGIAAAPTPSATATRSSAPELHSPYSPELSLGGYGCPPPGTGGGDDRTSNGEGGPNDFRMHDAVLRVRAGLFRMFPSRAGVLLYALMLLVGAWLWGRWPNTIEAVVLPRYVVHSALSWLPLSQQSSGLSAFDWLLRLGVLATVGATVLGLFRFVHVWLAFRGVLYGLSASPLLPAFRTLPKPVARLARLTPLDLPSAGIVALDEVIQDRWRTMRAIQSRHAEHFRGTDGQVVETLMNDAAPFPSRGSFDAELPLGTRYIQLRAALEAASRLARSTRETDPPPKGEKLAVERWLTAAEECAAAYAVDYVEWVFRSLRLLAVTLLASLVLATILLSSYPFQPQSVLRLLFFLVLAMAVVTFVVVAVQMNRDLVLSNINQTTEAQLDFDGTFLLNLALFALVPVFTLVSAEFPEVREFLFSWVTPLVRAVGSG